MSERAFEEAQGSDLQHQVDKLRADLSINRADIDALQGRSAEDHRRIDHLEERADLDVELIAELRAEGILSREQTAHLEEALRSSRKIGAAMGILMASRRVSEDEAFDILRKASQNTNRKLRVIAEEVAHTGDISQLPEL
ncbi:ANTAR domain-containing protein [Monashia sp. NPDC004114]